MEFNVEDKAKNFIIKNGGNLIIKKVIDYS